MKMIRPVSDLENLQFEHEIYAKLLEAEREAELTEKRYSSRDVLEAMRGAGCIAWSICLPPVRTWWISPGTSANRSTIRRPRPGWLWS